MKIIFPWKTQKKENLRSADPWEERSACVLGLATQNDPLMRPQQTLRNSGNLQQRIFHFELLQSFLRVGVQRPMVWCGVDLGVPQEKIGFSWTVPENAVEYFGTLNPHPTNTPQAVFFFPPEVPGGYWEGITPENIEFRSQKIQGGKRPKILCNRFG